MANTVRPRKRSAKPVKVDLHGLAEILRTIHASPNKLQEKFEQHMGEKDLRVILDSDTASKIRDFVIEHLPEDHPLMARFNRDNCDPATDPWCINT